VNVVGPFLYRDITEMTPEEWQETIALNLHTCFNVAHFAQPHLCESRGHIVNFAFSGWKTSSRGHVDGLLRGEDRHCRVDQVSGGCSRSERCSCQCPMSGIGRGSRGHRSRTQEHGRANSAWSTVRPEEIAATVRWLVTESPESMTGSLIAVSGAWEY